MTGNDESEVMTRGDKGGWTIGHGIILCGPYPTIFVHFRL